MGFYKVEIKAGDYPNRARVVSLSTGDTFYIMSDTPVKIGDQYKNQNAIISQITYMPKKWWRFWEKKKQIGFMVKWL